MTARPVAYIRRSSADAGSPGDISRDVQEHAIRELAARDGHNGDLRVFVDWARSADEEKEARRTEFRAMLSEVEAGRVSTIYAYALDRLHRSVTQTAKLVTACQRHNVRIVTQREGEVQHDTPDAWLRFTTLATFAEYELRVIKKRSEASMERRRARGDVFGHAPYGYKHARDATGRLITVRDDARPLEAVLEAVRAAGSILGGCRELERRGIPAPKGGSRWSTFTLTRIIEQNAPELLARRGPSGRRVPSSSTLAQLLRCHCGQIMSPNVARGQYQCLRGKVEGSAAHGKYNVTERDLLPWVQAEAARFRRPAEALEVATVTAERRVELETQRERLGWAVVDGLLSRDDAARKAAEIDAAITALDDAAGLEEIPTAIDWQDTPAALNGLLRALWESIQLGADMRPVRASWRLPQWRAS